MDNLVRDEIDKLDKKENPARKAWFTEILCHYFPEKYYLWNTPISNWLRNNNYNAPRGASMGAKYIYIAKELRRVIKNKAAGRARNLVELDGAMWVHRPKK